MSVERVTNNTGLRIPYYDQPQWHVFVNENWDIIDTLFSTLTRISGLTGAWQNATAYAQGQRAIDTTTNTLYEVLVSHTSASTGTFTADRAANPTYWGEVINLYSINGRAIQEVETVIDAAAEFVSGGTFELDGSNPRHYYVKVGDTSNPLTANMVVDLNPASSDWSTGGKVTIIKGDLSEFRVTVSGFDVDGLGTYTLKRYRDGIECSYQTTDNNSGPGASGQKFERGIQSSTYESDAFRAIGPDKYFGTDTNGDIVGYDIDPILLPNTIDSDGSGAWSPDYDTEIDGYGIVTFARATGDVTAGPLELTWPAMPVGAIHNIRFEEAATITAATRVFTLNVNWSDGAGVGVLEINEGTKTWDDFAPAIGDTISGGPFGTPTTIAALISTTVIHTTTLPGETGSGDINLTAPADSIDTVRTISTPTMSSSGVVMVLSRLTASTATSRGELISGERLANAPESPSAEYPEGISVVRIRDSNGDVAQVGDASDGTIIIDDEIRAVAKLGPTTVTETAVTASRLLTIGDIQYEIVTGEGLPSAVTERTLVCLADPVSTPIALTIGNTAGATRNWPILILVDPDQTGTVTLALVENGTINGVAGTGTWQFYVNRPTPILIRNPTGTAPIVTTGAMMEDGKATIVSDSGTLTVTEHNQRIILATDDVTVPAIVGLQGVVVASGAERDVTFGTDTIAVPDGAMLPFVVLTSTTWLRPPDPIESAVGDGS